MLLLAGLSPGFASGTLGFVRSHLIEVASKPVEPALPSLAIAFHERRRLAQRRGFKMNLMNAPALFAPNQPRALHHLDVFGNDIERAIEIRRQIGHTPVTLGEQRQHSSTRRMRESCESGIESVSHIHPNR